MTHRVHPFVFRLGETTTWKSRWFNHKSYRAYLREDTLLREWLRKTLLSAHISRIEIERSPNILNIIVKTSRPGILIGRGGEGIAKLKKNIEKKLRDIWKWPRGPRVERARQELKLTIEEVRSPETDAEIVAAQIREDVEKRVRFRRVLKQAVDRVMSHKEVKGVKIMLKGRLDGSEMARVEWLKQGRVPLQTLRANIDYALAEAHTTYGVIGIKVWIYKGEVFEKELVKQVK